MEFGVLVENKRKSSAINWLNWINIFGNLSQNLSQSCSLFWSESLIFACIGWLMNIEDFFSNSDVNTFGFGHYPCFYPPTYDIPSMQLRHLFWCLTDQFYHKIIIISTWFHGLHHSPKITNVTFWWNHIQSCKK